MTFNIIKKHSKKFVILVLLVLAVIVTALYFLISHFIPKKNTPVENTITSSETYNKDAVNKAFVSSGIQTKTVEPFQNNQNDIVYNSINIIKDNFENFINTYFPILDVNLMNKMLKDNYNINKTMQEILNENSNISLTPYVNLLQTMTRSFITLIGNKTDTILCGLGIITILKLDIPLKFYYLNDYEQNNDFIIYIIPSTFDITKLTNTNSEIQNINNFTDVKSLDRPYKLGINQLNIYLIKDLILSAKNKNTTSSALEISEQEIDNVVQIFINNREPVLKYLRLLLLGPFIKLYNNTDLTASSKIAVDLDELSTPNKYFTSEMTPYLPPRENASQYHQMFNFIFSNYQNASQNQPARTMTSQYTTQSTAPIIRSPTISANTNNLNIIKLYSEENFTGNVKQYDISSANDFFNSYSENLPKLSVYDSNDGAPPKSIKFEEPVDYNYIIELYYVYSDNSDGTITMLSSSNVNSINTKTNYNENNNVSTTVTGILKNIFVYKQQNQPQNAPYLATPTMQIIPASTITALSNPTQTDIIKLYSDINFTGFVKIFNVMSANIQSYNTPVLSIYNSEIDPIPPKSLEIIQPVNNTTTVSNYNYYIILNYVYSDGATVGMIQYNSLNSIELTQTATLNGIQKIATLKNIFVYKQNN
jgi:hypothetical protein